MQVMVATSGARLLPEDAVSVLCKELLPMTYLVTPNIPEAKLLLQEAGKTPTEVHDLQGLKLLAKAVHSLGPNYVLIKGGHLPLTENRKVARSDDEKAIVANVLYDGSKSEVVELPYQSSKDTHGTGCTLACMSPFSISSRDHRADQNSRDCMQSSERVSSLEGCTFCMSIRRGSNTHESWARERFRTSQSLPCASDPAILQVSIVSLLAGTNTANEPQEGTLSTTS